jgi:hypothetical protein
VAVRYAIQAYPRAILASATACDSPAWALLESLLRDELTERAAKVETSNAPGDALELWLRDFVACATN